jgi:hypothetical protein
MFHALLAHLQEALHKQQLVYRVRIMLAGCYTRNIPIVVYAALPEDEQVVLETHTGR